MKTDVRPGGQRRSYRDPEGPNTVEGRSHRGRKAGGNCDEARMKKQGEKALTGCAAKTSVGGARRARESFIGDYAGPRWNAKTLKCKRPVKSSQGGSFTKNELVAAGESANRTAGKGRS